MPGIGRTYRLIAVGYRTAAAVVAVWTVGVAATGGELSWIGLNVALVAAYATAGWLAGRGDPRLALAATASATAVLLDAWFDVTTATGDWLPAAIALAVTVELPFALASAAVAAWVVRPAKPGTTRSVPKTGSSGYARR